MTIEAPHTHHWVIESSAPKDVAGICKGCGLTKTFSGGGSDSPYEAFKKTNYRYHKPYDDDGLRPEDMRRFRWSDNEAF